MHNLYDWMSPDKHVMLQLANISWNAVEKNVVTLTIITMDPKTQFAA